MDLPPLLLKNGGADRNMCSLNSNIQLLRHVPEFCDEVQSSANDSALLDVLNYLLSRVGTKQVSSASMLREVLGQVSNQNRFNSGVQQDTVELLNFLLDHSHHNLFSFDTSNESKFTTNNRISPCPTCKHVQRIRYSKITFPN